MEDLYSVEHNGAPSQTAVVANHKKESQGQKGMVLPFKPLALTFHNVNYYVDMPSVSSQNDQ